jgi:hypothetical protein
MKKVGKYRKVIQLELRVDRTEYLVCPIRTVERDLKSPFILAV